MPYREPIFFPGSYAHVYNRGNEKRNIFLETRDYERFLDRMVEYKTKHQVSIICYCLMPNHFHLLLRQNSEESLSIFMHKLNVSYSMYFNKHYERIGHLFQGRFKAKLVIKDEYLLHLTRYIHLNPLEIIGLQSKIEEYPWSSYAEYLNLAKIQICDKEIVLKQLDSSLDYKKYQEFVKQLVTEKEFLQIKSLIIEPRPGLETGS